MSLLLRPKGLVKAGLVAFYNFQESKNLFTYSDRFGNAAWTKTYTTITPKIIAAPDGTVTADKVVETSDAGTPAHFVSQSPALEDNKVYCFSVHAKAGERVWIRLRVMQKDGTACQAWFNLSTGVIGQTSGPLLGYGISPAGGDFYRCYIAFNSMSGATTPVFYVYLAIADNGYGYLGDGTSGAYLWGPQVNGGLFPKVYYKTVDKQRLWDVSVPAVNLLSINQANCCEDGTTGGFAATAGTTISVESIKVYRGAKSLKMVCTGTVVQEGFHTGNVRVACDPSSVFAVSMHLATDTVGGDLLRMHLFEYNSSGAYLRSTNTTHLVGTDFARYTHVGTVGSDCFFVAVGVYATNISSKTFYADDLMLTSGAIVLPFVMPPNHGQLGSTSGVDTNDPAINVRGQSFGADDYDVVAVSENINALTGQITIMAVVRPTGYGGGDFGRVVDKLKFQMYNRQNISQDILFVFRRASDDTQRSAYTFGNRMAFFNNHIVAGMYDKQNLWVWANDFKRLGGASETDNINSHSSNPLYIGNSNNANRNWSGDIMCVLIYNRALSDREYMQNYWYLRRWLEAERGIVFYPSPFLKSLLDTANLRFLWPFQEDIGTTAFDHAFNATAINGAYSGVTLAQPGPNANIPLVAGFSGAASSVVTADALCSVRNCTTITFVAVINVTNTAGSQYIWWESTADDAAAERYTLYLDSDEKLNFRVRSGLAAQTISRINTNSPLSSGFHIIHATVQVAGAGSSMALFVDGQPIVDVTTSLNFGTDTIIADTAPASGPFVGRANASNYFQSGLAFIGQYARILTNAEILAHARAGGFAV